MLGFAFRYRSAEKRTKLKSVVKLKDMKLLGDDPVLKDYVRRDTVIDAKKPVDEGKQVKGRVKMRKKKKLFGDKDGKR